MPKSLSYYCIFLLRSHEQTNSVLESKREKKYLCLLSYIFFLIFTSSFIPMTCPHMHSFNPGAFASAQKGVIDTVTTYLSK